MEKSKVLNKILRIALPLLILSVFTYGVYYIWFRKPPAQTSQTKTAKVTKGEIKPTLSLTGTVSSANETGVNFKTSGELTEVNVKVGDVVAAGQQLAKIDNTELQRQVTIAEANLSSANAKLNQVESQPNSSDYDVEIQEAAVVQAKENYTQALDDLDRATLASPITGTILAVNASVGEQVAGGTSASGGSSQSISTNQTGNISSSNNSSSSSSSDFIVIADLTQLRIESSVDQVDIPKIAKDQSVTITFDAIPDKEFKGKVIDIDPTASTSENVVTYDIATSIENPDAKIQLGMTADLEIDLGRKESVLAVPNLAIKTKDGSKVVGKMIDGTATDVTVEVGLSDEDNTEIISGLLEGDEIVVDTFSRTSSNTGGTRQNQNDRDPGMMPGF